MVKGSKKVLLYLSYGLLDFTRFSPHAYVMEIRPKVTHPEVQGIVTGSLGSQSKLFPPPMGRRKLRHLPFKSFPNDQITQLSKFCMITIKIFHLGAKFCPH